MYRFMTAGTCAKAIEFDVKDGKVTFVRFIGGCRGNAAGLSNLAVGRTVDDVVRLLKGIECRGGTSCPDQFATALQEYSRGNAHEL